jgi:hypothetical protein
MEAFMDWKLTYRSLKDLEALIGKIPEAEITEKRLFPDASGNVGYLEGTKR